MKRHYFLAAVFALAAWPCAPVRADAPLAPPSTHEVVSRNFSFRAISSPENGTHIFSNATNQQLWSMAGWFRWLFVSNDGANVVSGYDGMNLVPDDYADDLVLFTFWEKGRKIRSVTLKEVIPQKSILTKTVSHYHWGSIEGINDKGLLVVIRADGMKLYFDVKTGIQQ